MKKKDSLRSPQQCIKNKLILLDSFSFSYSSFLSPFIFFFFLLYSGVVLPFSIPPSLFYYLSPPLSEIRCNSFSRSSSARRILGPLHLLFSTPLSFRLSSSKCSEKERGKRAEHWRTELPPSVHLFIFPCIPSPTRLSLSSPYPPDITHG